ncbi:MAG: hypothetical protein ACETVM_04005 [Candidatus Bathyarchaeia archaeon]
MVKKSLYEAAWILGLIAGIVCILFALFSFLGYIPEILEKPIKGLAGMVSAGILGIMGFLILGAARMTKTGGKRATTGGIFLLIFGFVAYLVGGAIGAVAAILTGLLVIIAKYV